MEIVWTQPALSEWERIARYIADEFGKKAVKSFVADTQKKERQLMKFPEAGAIEPLLRGLSREYHSASISKYNKIIYIICDSCIYIVDVWDMRRNPSVLKNRMK